MNVQDSVVNTLGSQTDMVATLFAQLGMDASAFHYSKNLLVLRRCLLLFMLIPMLQQW